MINWKYFKVVFYYFIKEPFPLLSNKDEKLIFILSNTFWALFFLRVFAPFQMNSWYNLGYVSYTEVVLYFCITAFVTLFFTEFYLRNWLKIYHPSYLQYLLWFLLEIFILSINTFLIDWLVNKFPEMTLSYLFDNLKYTFLIALIPFTITILLLFYLQQYRLAKSLSRKIIAAKNNSGSLAIEDEKGRVALNVDSNHILFFKTEDNYVNVHYLLGGKIKTELIRTTLKNIEHKCNTPEILRVNRSYSVNVNNITISKKTLKGYVIFFDFDTSIQIPVSSSYQKKFKQYLLDKSQ